MVFEPFILQLRLKPKDAFVLRLYRLPSGSIPIFMDLLDKQLEKLATGSHLFMMLGDFNIHLHELDTSVSMDFLQLCMSHGSFPTINICTRVTSSKLIDKFGFFPNLVFQFQELLLLMYQIILGFQQDLISVFPRSQHR